MPVLGIDLGTLTSTVATIQKGAIQIVLNDISARQTPTIVSFTKRNRLTGDRSLAELKTNFSNTCRGLKNLLGLLNRSDSKIDLYESYCDFDLNKDGRGAYRVHYCGEKRSFTVTQVVAIYLRALADMANKYLNCVNREIVISYPPWFSDSQKESLLAASRIAGLDCLRVMNEDTALALDYGMHRLKEFNSDTPVVVVFVMIGHANSSITIVDFYKEKLEIQSEVFRKDLGGRNIDHLLAQYFADSFKKKYNLDPMAGTKTRIKLEEMANKTKKILSANSDAYYNIECLVDDHDLTGSISRSDFEDILNQSFIPTLVGMLDDAMKIFGQPIDKIHNIEVVGGCPRIPCVQRAISNFFNKPLSKTLNADECVARGCALQAAMSSLHYRVRDYYCYERVWRPVNAICRQLPYDQTQLTSGEVVEIIQFGSPLNYIAEIKLPLGAMGYEISASYGDPHVVNSDFLGTCSVHLSNQNLEDASHVIVRAGFSPHGIFTFIDSYIVNISQAAENDMDTERSESNKRMLEVQIRPFYGKCDMDELDGFCKDEDKMQKVDAAEQDRLMKLNDLETCIYDFRDKINGSHKQFISSNDATKLCKLIGEVEEWLYENNEAAISEFDSRICTINTHWEPVQYRFKVYNEKKQNLPRVFETLRQVETFCADTENPKYASITLEQRSELASDCEALRNFLDRSQKEEASKPLDSDPCFTMETVNDRLKSLTVRAQALMDTAKKAKKEEETNKSTNDDPNHNNGNNSSETNCGDGTSGNSVEDKIE
ncbi:Heat shock protein homolog pss1 [Babesia microti strain RI]|uniref:Heat shock protein homolog pss1 n=1 Tax=Babesia microti (strain RI) TaxID=1133968 RepID=A0A1N6LY81_BABMR|nr:Heat shock protein homolog pss1 [Babesia microti strain RI]SIO73839.1 Heat shock protein homolog pss1 [Babesia microti strain RI]|eukprot:XP_021337894.1 Heat shock protein homolog pss1 [Babesia microti strain RI]